MKFYCYKIHLHEENHQVNIPSSKHKKYKDRKSFLMEFFTSKIDFSLIGKPYHYDYISTENGVIGGVFGEPKKITYNKGPARRWEYGEIPEWDPYFLIVDPSKNAQTLYVEAKGLSAQKRFVDSVAEYAIKIAGCPWSVRIKMLTDEVQLKEIFQIYHNQISKISIEFPPANMPTGVQGPLNKARKLFSEANAETTIEVDAIGDSIDVDAEVIQDALDLGTETGAGIKVFKSKDKKKRGRDEKVFDSENTEKAKKIDVDVSKKEGNLISIFKSIIRVIMNK